MTIGVAAYRDEQELTLGKLFALPFGKQREWRLPMAKSQNVSRNQPNSSSSNVKMERPLFIPVILGTARQGRKSDTRLDSFSNRQRSVRG